MGCSKITADGDYSHEIKRRLLLGSKAITNLDSTLKSRDITLPTKVCLVKAMVFPVVMYVCESWTIKKAECQLLMKITWGALKTLPWPSCTSEQLSQNWQGWGSVSEVILKAPQVIKEH